MNGFVKYEVWKDYWCFKPTVELDISILKRLDYCSWFKKSKNELEIRIESLEDANEPTPEQIDTLRLITDNQFGITESIFDYYQKLILPVYKEAIDIKENEIAHNPSELSIVFGANHIEIPSIKNSKSAYFLIQFDFKYDVEHGLYILFKETTPIDFFGEGDKNYDAIELYENGLKNRNDEPLKFNLYHLNGETVFQERYHFDEQINFPLRKGTYRAFITCNQREYSRNFYAPKDMEYFTMRKILTY